MESRDREANDAEGNDVERTRDHQYGGVIETVIEHPPCDLAKHNATHSAAETDESGQFAECLFRNEIGGLNLLQDV